MAKIRLLPILTSDKNSVLSDHLAMVEGHHSLGEDNHQVLLVAILRAKLTGVTLASRVMLPPLLETLVTLVVMSHLVEVVLEPLMTTVEAEVEKEMQAAVVAVVLAAWSLRMANASRVANLAISRSNAQPKTRIGHPDGPWSATSATKRGIWPEIAQQVMEIGIEIEVIEVIEMTEIETAEIGIGTEGIDTEVTEETETDLVLDSLDLLRTSDHAMMTTMVAIRDLTTLLQRT